MIVDLITEDARWDQAGLEPSAEAACAATLRHLGHGGDYEISLLGCDDARIAVLNADFRGKPTPTNVLSWPSDERAADEDGAMPDPPAEDFPGEPIELGDIAIAYETCAREAAEQGKSFEDHVTHLLVHGCLHLLGFDHIRPGDAALMERLEVEILATLGVANPYE